MLSLRAADQCTNAFLSLYTFLYKACPGVVTFSGSTLIIWDRQETIICRTTLVELVTQTYNRQVESGRTGGSQGLDHIPLHWDADESFSRNVYNALESILKCRYPGQARAAQPLCCAPPSLELHVSQTCLASKWFTGTNKHRYTGQQPGTRANVVLLVNKT